MTHAESHCPLLWYNRACCQFGLSWPVCHFVPVGCARLVLVRPYPLPLYVRTGGVVPNVARELHEEHLGEVARDALQQSQLTLEVGVATGVAGESLGVGRCSLVFTGGDPHCCHQRARSGTLFGSRPGICQEAGSGEEVSLCVCSCPCVRCVCICLWGACVGGWVWVW